MAPDERERRVRADELIERGDSLGEFIALQLDKPEAPRAEQLLALHGRTWVGALDQAIERAQFVGGVLTRAQLRHAVPEQALYAPQWSSLRELQAGAASAQVYEKVVKGAAFDALERIHVFGTSTLEAAHRHTLRSVAIVAEFERTKAIVSALIERRYEGALCIHDEALDCVLGSKLVPSLTSLTVTGSARTARHVLKRLPSSCELEYRQDGHFERLNLHTDPWSGSLRFKPTPDGLEVTVTAAWARVEVLERLELPTMKSLVVHGATPLQRTEYLHRFATLDLHFEPETRPRGIVVLR